MNVVIPLLPLFGDATGDPDYQGCRDFDMNRPLREKLERAWARVWHLCPEGAAQFVGEFRRNFHARAWELYLLDVLASAGLTLEPAPKRGPDICTRLPSGVRCWIEAVAPTPGTGADAVAQPSDGRVRSLPKDTNLILRYRSVLEEKLEKLDRYKRAGIVGPGDAYVIAVYQGAIDNSDLYDNELPGLLRAVLPYGETVFIAPVGGDGPHYNQVQHREAVLKANKESPVSTTFFEEPRTEFVSGVLYASQAIWNLPWSAPAALSLIHRPDAKVPVPIGVIPTRGEIWRRADGTLAHRGKCAPYGPLSKG